MAFSPHKVISRGGGQLSLKGERMRLARINLAHIGLLVSAIGRKVAPPQIVKSGKQVALQLETFGFNERYQCVVRLVCNSINGVWRSAWKEVNQ
jgi:hypothetical protein